MARRRERVTKQVSKKTARRGNQNMLWIIGGVVLLALVVTGVLIFANTRPTPVGAFNTVEKQDWPQPDGKALGPAGAKVVIREFSDFQCPFCQQFNSSVMPRIVEEYVATGRVRFEYHHFIVIDGNVGGNESRRSAQASECASEQGAFWDYHEIVFANQQGEGRGAFTDDRLRAFAESLGLDMNQFNSCFNAQKLAKNVTDDENLGRSMGVRGTPSLFVNDRKIENPMSYDQVKAAIEEALNNAAN